MPTCQELTDRANDYIDGRLTLADRLRFAVHLAHCQRCRLHVRQLRATVGALARLPHEPAPADVRADLLARFQRARPISPGTTARVGKPLQILAGLDKRLGRTRGFAAAALVLVGLLLMLLRPEMHGGPAHTGFSCLGIELATGLLPILALGYLASSERCRLDSAIYAAIAAAGSGLGFFALEHICELSDVVPHVLVFHIGGFAAAVLIAAIVPRLARTG